jgi:hypothetical protein
MTPTASPSVPSSLDLGTINEIQQTIVRALHDQVCTWEQEALDASKRGDYRAAHQYTDWAFAADLCASKASSVCTSAFLDAVRSLTTVVQDQRSVQLPNLNRSAKDLALDVLATELASERPEPC